jgi:hypothetical protein
VEGQGIYKKNIPCKAKKWQKIGYFNRRRRVAIKIALTALVAYLVAKEFANVQTIKHGRKTPVPNLHDTKAVNLFFLPLCR